MDRNRLLLVCAALAAVAVVALGVLVGVQPQLSLASATELQVRSIDEQNAERGKDLETLRSDAERMDQVATRLATLKSSVPDSADIPAFLEQLNQAASRTDVSITAITTSDAAAYTNPVPASTATSATTSGSAPAATPTPTPTPSASATPAAPVAPLPVTDPLITGANFSTIPVSVTITAERPDALAYLSALQHGQRLFLVDSVTQAAASGGETESSWTFGGYIYALTNAATTASTASTTTSQAAGGD